MKMNVTFVDTDYSNAYYETDYRNTDLKLPL
jgi:hypothetical protein